MTTAALLENPGEKAVETNLRLNHEPREVQGAAHGLVDGEGGEAGGQEKEAGAGAGGAAESTAGESTRAEAEELLAYLHTLRLSVAAEHGQAAVWPYALNPEP